MTALLHVAVRLGMVMIAAVGGMWLFPSLAEAQDAHKAGPQKFMVGKMEVIPLLDEARDMPVGIFRGADAAKMQALAPGGKAPSGIYGFLIRTGDQVILVDTGFGRSEAPQSLLLQSLKGAGTAPEAVTLVVLTHLHRDHVGGLVWKGKAAFPKAAVLVGDIERDFWLNEAARAKDPGRMENAVLARDNLGLYGDRVAVFSFGDEIVPGLTAVAAIGHTPGHAVFMLESDGERMLFWGDTTHGAVLQFPDPAICASFDMDMPKAVETRKALMKLAAEQNIPIAGAHLPQPGIGRVGQGEAPGTFTFTPGM